MTWTYKQSTGELSHNGKHIEIGYSGVLTNKNNPDREQVKGMGPIPRGSWKIAGVSSSKGPLTIILMHVSGNTYQRDPNSFRIHDDKRHGVQGFASEGCIIMHHATRLLLKNSMGETLEVIR